MPVLVVGELIDDRRDEAFDADGEVAAALNNVIVGDLFAVARSVLGTFFLVATLEAVLAVELFEATDDGLFGTEGAAL